MGISGLLPLLKPIQVQKHLSEYAGQTLAVDAYVWLHRGVYSCATELATGKATTKYVDYAMHRVRLLRYHHIEPYIVFDGGPLPAKRGTEVERQRKRAECLARGKALTAQGKKGEAREWFIKSVDVTTEMAFQFIKALRAENVPYVVAPYEADAQLAYLELSGLVDGIITEDSDLLVFGCRNVLFKLDVSTATVVSISRSSFSINGLLGWSDVQFRAMAILSGCDYLASIAGIGLKTAWTLLKKHRTVENVVKALMRDGKKNVPKAYLQAFRLAEKVFLYQRVYDPSSEKLVCLNEVPVGEQWDEEVEAYVGRDLEPALAKQLALGDVDPTTLRPMVDINPSYKPHALKTIDSNGVHHTGKGKAKAGPQKSASDGLLDFFTRVPKPNQSSPKRLSSSQPTPRVVTAGRDSGKRTLADVMDRELSAKRKKMEPREGSPIRSRFFASGSVENRARTPVAGPSKENVPPFEELDLDFEVEDEGPEIIDLVEQEDGYISPSPVGDDTDIGTDAPDFSSPVRSRDNRGELDDAEPISSPPGSRRQDRLHGRKIEDSEGDELKGRVLVGATPLRSRSGCQAASTASEAGNLGVGVDLRDVFGDDLTSEIGCFEEEGGISTPTAVRVRSHAWSSTTPQQKTSLGHERVITMIDRDEETRESEARAQVIRNETVSLGWSERWSFGGKSSSCRLRRHGALRPREKDLPSPRPPASPRSATKRKRLGKEIRKSTPLRPDARLQSGPTAKIILGVRSTAPFRLR